MISATDIERRALAACHRAGARSGDAYMQPGSCHVREAGGRDYAVLRNVRGVLSVYRVRPDDRLKNLKRWPAELN